MHRLRARARALGRGGDKGASTIEFLVFTPLLFFFLLLMVQFAMYFFAQEVAQSAAQAADRTARQEAASAPGQWARDAAQTGRNRISSLGGSLLPRSRVQPAPDGANVKVTVTGSVVHVVPFLDLTVTAVADGPIERFIPDAG